MIDLRRVSLELFIFHTAIEIHSFTHITLGSTSV